MAKYLSRYFLLDRLLAAALIVSMLSASTVLLGQDTIPALDTSTQNVAFDDHFLAETMRVDYYHCGTATEQHVALERIVADGPWAGSRRHLIDPLGRGEYFFEVRDQAAEQLLYSRGFCSVFGEWQTIAEAKNRWGTFHESLRFPWPKHPVTVVLKHRVEGEWQVVWSNSIDPESRFVTRAETTRRDCVWTLFEHGDPADKVDLVLLGDGFTQAELPAFHEAARRLTEALFSVEPFQSRRSDFNVRAIDVMAVESGVSSPREKRFRRSPLSCEYNTFDLPRYVLTFDNKTLRDVSAQAPYDCLVILLNEKTYGGGGIYNDQTIVAAHHELAPYVMIHEFGHHLAGLADEYYSSDVAYETGQPIQREPWEPNVTALLGGAPPKWQELLTIDIPIPTPWNKAAFESPAARRSASKATDEQDPKSPPKSLAELLAENAHYGKVGAFEGARYESTGLFRPAVNCAMFSRSTIEFCPVCRRAIEDVIDLHVK